MVVLVKGCGIDHHPSMLQKATEYAEKTLKCKQCAVIGSFDQLGVLSRFTELSDNDCLIIDDVQLFAYSVQEALKLLVVEASKTKTIILLIDKDKCELERNPLIALAEKTVDIEPNEKSIQFMRENGVST